MFTFGIPLMAWNVDYDSAMNSVIYNKKKKLLKDKNIKFKNPKKKNFIQTKKFFFFNFLIQKNNMDRLFCLFSPSTSDIASKIS